MKNYSLGEYYSSPLIFLCKEIRILADLFALVKIGFKTLEGSRYFLIPWTWNFRGNIRKFVFLLEPHSLAFPYFCILPSLTMGQPKF